MKNLIYALVLAFVAVGCSSGNSDGPKTGAGGGGGVTTFSQKLAGTWVSECQQANNNQSGVEIFDLKADSTGTSIVNMYNGPDCQGNPAVVDQAKPLTYVAGAERGGFTDVSLTREGQTLALQVSVQGDQMQVKSGVQITNYTRISKPVQTPLVDFDSIVKGAWASDCQATQDGRSVTEILSFTVPGSVVFSQNIYAGPQCQGQPTAPAGQTLTYQVQNFAGGRGRLTVNGQTLDIFIQGTTMTITSAQGSANYTKIN